MQAARSAAAFAMLLLAAAGAAADPVPGQGDWETTLLARDLDADGVVDAYYDRTLDISWLADADPIGYVDWQEATAWAATLEVHGIGGWRLPASFDVGGDGCNYSTGGTDCGEKVLPASSEMAHLYYVTLGNLGWPDAGWGLRNSGPFRDLQPDFYASSTQDAREPDLVWVFDAYYGTQFIHGSTKSTHAFAVHDGDIAAIVPEPGRVALTLAGLGVLAMRWRMRLPRVRCAKGD